MFCIYIYVGRKPERGIDLNSQDDESGGSDREYESAVISIDWDPHSPDYALIVRYQCGLVLLDTNRLEISR